MSAGRLALPVSALLRRVGLVATLLIGATAHGQVSQSPLYLGGGSVPGNLALVPSVEWPTINSVANLGDYDDSRGYAGYFDAGKCYAYHYSASEPERHFYPVATTSNRRCNGAQWSGNFLNWAVTQTIDPFRSALTGGLRVRDTPTETWLEKARHDGQGGSSIYPNRRLPASGNNATAVGNATPFSASWMRMRVQGLGNRLRFRLQNDGVDHNVVAYDPAVAVGTNRAYELSVRVKVCDASVGLEPNCRQYSQGWKPEGLVQQYSADIRYSVFGYLNDSDMLRDGGVLRARQKFVGGTLVEPGTGEAANPRMEWDASTGVLHRNPEPDDATSTASAFGVTVEDSGVINYLNKFGQLTTNNHKSHDPVSELYYSALRYFRNVGNVDAYSTPTPTHDSSASAATKARWVDGFPVVTDWNDPIQYSCQKNVILGIGDAYTHRDKNLPGSAYGSDEPSKPAAVSGDDAVDVIAATNKVAELEGISIGHNPFTGRANSAFIAGLAYDANTRDQRDDWPGSQTVSTFWVDVLENQTLEPRNRNQYWLAAKYGGFRPRPPVECENPAFTPPSASYCSAPEFGDPYERTDALPEHWWHTNADTLTPFGNASGASYLRADNYYVAGEAGRMVDSLTEAFAAIASQVRSSASSLTTNSTRIETDTAVFQALVDSHDWSGDLLARSVSSDGIVAIVPRWSAAQRLDALTDAQIAQRRIFTVTPPTAGADGELRSTTGRNFTWTALAASQRESLRRIKGSATLDTVTVGQQRLAYLRGERALERSESSPANPFRERGSRLGDVVNSDPQFIHKQDFGYARLPATWAGGGVDAGADYTEFRDAEAYQGRTPLVVVGANDGMLHGFDASLGSDGGLERFAYVPHGVMSDLYELTLPAYAHRYYVDGTPRVSDAWLGAASGWRTVVVGTTGAGGRSVFALDVTDPAQMSASSVLWEFTHPDLGYPSGQPAIVALPNGRFGVIITSGYESAAADGRIWILDARDGSVIHALEVTGSGELGAPLVVDLDGDRVADRIYVGDTDGKLWRFDLAGSSTSQWRAPSNLRSGNTPVPLFVARGPDGVSQAITAPLASAFDERGEHMLFFGTGSFYRVDDNVVGNDPQVESFYGIVDRGTPITARSQLREQEILLETTVGSFRARALSERERQAADRGWFIDLQWKTSLGGPGPRGERVVARAVLRSGRVMFSTLIPSDDPCRFGGDSWVMAVDLDSGGRLNYVFFDINGDGLFDEDDLVTLTGSDGETIRVPVSGIGDDVGIVKTPVQLSSAGEGGRDRWICYAGSGSEATRCVQVSGSPDAGRRSWREVR